MTHQDQITDLQAANTRLVLENRALRAHNKLLESLVGPVNGGGRRDTRRADVTAFFPIAGQEIGSSPHVPPDNHPHGVRFRARLIVSEVFELLEACFDTSSRRRSYAFEAAKMSVDEFLEEAPINVDLVSAADALADIDYTVEGARVAWGIDGVPIWREVHRSNMAKFGGPVVDGKLMKPAGWTPPDIEGELRKQGWEP